jgi:hypothetical protein
MPAHRADQAGVKPLRLVAGAGYVSQYRGLRDEASPTGVAAPKVDDLPAGTQQGRSFWRDHQVRTNRTARHIPRSGPMKGHVFSIGWLKRNHDAPVGMRPSRKNFRKLRFFTSPSVQYAATFPSYPQPSGVNTKRREVDAAEEALGTENNARGGR